MVRTRRRSHAGTGAALGIDGERRRIMKRLYFIEITDTFGGEANYSWVTRHAIRAKSELGAVQRMSSLAGLHWHAVGMGRYDSASGATCFFIDEFDNETHGRYRLNTDERGAA